MHFLFKYTLLTILLLSFTSCGDGGRNNQGVSLTHLGWFSPPDATAVDCESMPSLSRAAVPLGSAFETGGFNPAGSGAFIKFKNNFSTVGVTFNRVEYRFDVIGSDIAVPNTSVPYGFFLAPGSTGTDETFIPDSTLPDGITTEPSTICTSKPLVPDSIMEFLVFNLNSLTLPATVAVETRGVAVTTAGDEVKTNWQIFNVTLTPPILIN